MIDRIVVCVVVALNLLPIVRIAAVQWHAWRWRRRLARVVVELAYYPPSMIHAHDGTRVVAFADDDYEATVHAVIADSRRKFW